MNFEGEVAVVTGGGTGIGKAITSLLVEAEVKTVIFSRSKGNKLAEELGSDCQFIPVDVTDYPGVKEGIEEVLKRYERVDYLVNNAGMREDKLLMRMEPEEWYNVLEVNLTGAFNCTKAVVRPMIKQRQGAIVNISSIAGIAGNAGQANYSASKAGVIGFTKAMARELGSRNIRVNSVAPGFVDTAMTREVPEENRGTYLESIPLNDMGTPEDVANAVGFLLSQESAYITGCVLKVDGGLLMD